MSVNSEIPPHGGRLVNRIVSADKKAELVERCRGLRVIGISQRTVSDLELLSSGGFSPLEGFMGQRDYHRVVRDRHLDNGLPWTIPITLAISREEAQSVRDGEVLALRNDSQVLGLIEVEERFSYDREEEARLVYGQTDSAHPGVQTLYRQGEVLLGGKITLIQKISHDDFLNYRLDPADTRRRFQERGWRTVVGFQTRNPVHRAHEYIQKCALEIVDGLLLHPLVGETKGDDIPAAVRMSCFEALLQNYYPASRVVLSVMPAAMRYAGPREAIFHAIVRKNYGCTHFIVGRDHAGVGNYYPPLAAQEVFNDFPEQDLGIKPLFFDNTFFCRRCGHMASSKTCPHPPDDRLSLSGTQVREMLREGKELPEEFTRREVAAVLLANQ